MTTSAKSIPTHKLYRVVKGRTELDKIATRSEMGGADVSRQGVQRDLLPLVEGTTVSTKYGMVKTDHILFIASGAFHFAKPSDLIPELQGRFPIRVELDSLSVGDFEKILTGTDACLTKQYEALLGTESVKIEFRPEAIRRLTGVFYRVRYGEAELDPAKQRRLGRVIGRVEAALAGAAPGMK